MSGFLHSLFFPHTGFNQVVLSYYLDNKVSRMSPFSWWVLQHCTGFARLVWGRLRVHRAFVYSDWFVCNVYHRDSNMMYNESLWVWFITNQITMWIYHQIHQSHLIQPIAFGVSFNHNLWSQSPWSLFDGTWQKRPRELHRRLRFENEEMTLQMQ